MALVKKGISIKRFTVLTLMLVVVIGVILYVVFRQSTVPLTNTTLNTNQGGNQLPTLINLGSDVFNQTIFKSLEKHGDFPVQTGQVGRSNPFTPF